MHGEICPLCGEDLTERAEGEACKRCLAEEEDMIEQGLSVWQANITKKPGIFPIDSETTLLTKRECPDCGRQCENGWCVRCAKAISDYRPKISK